MYPFLLPLLLEWHFHPPSFDSLQCCLALCLLYSVKDPFTHQCEWSVVYNVWFPSRHCLLCKGRILWVGLKSSEPQWSDHIQQEATLKKILRTILSWGCLASHYFIASLIFMYLCQNLWQRIPMEELVEPHFTPEASLPWFVAVSPHGSPCLSGMRILLSYTNNMTVSPSNPWKSSSPLSFQFSGQTTFSGHYHTDDFHSHSGFWSQEF